MPESSARQTEATVQAELVFSTGDLAQTRFAVSPLWEIVTGLRSLAADPAHTPSLHRRWAAQVRPRLTSAGLDRGRLAELVPAEGYLPDFLNPTPASPAPTLAEEVSAILATPTEQVHRDLNGLTAGRGGRLPAGARALRRDPGAGLARLATEIESYWQLAVAPYWARIRALLEADIARRARTVAAQGAGRLLDELHPALSWKDDRLTLSGRNCVISRTGTGPGLLLIPSVFAWPCVLTRAVPDAPPQLAYPADGIATLWERPARGGNAGSAVAGVLGRTRAQLLAGLDAPASTTELAARAGLSAPSVSEHLTALRAAGLATAHRAGRSVLYARTPLADALLTGPNADPGADPGAGPAQTSRRLPKRSVTSTPPSAQPR
ncbi:DNA-binding transcriptional ArsR family regulator [Streptacidiphilus sp. MAP12-20]|uniref:ArsR/SmtB family transcription factor n=1 Tax=Streptacidiphilus sp. MAP12-20 TaxID=3156299 RepID=UPI003518AAFF